MNDDRRGGHDVVMMYRWMHAACTLLLLCAEIAHADESNPEPAPLVVEVSPPGSVDPEALARALQADLGVQIAWATEAPADGPHARLRIAVSPDGDVRLEFVRDGGAAAQTREIDAPRDPAERTLTIALVAANLVRDESAELLAILRIAPAPPPEPAPPVVIVGRPEPSLPSPIAPSPSDERPRLIDLALAIDFAPMIGFSSAFAGSDRRSVSLGVLGALSGSVDGLALSGVIDLALGGVRGLQAAPVLAIAGGDLSGVQMATIAIVGGDVEGAQAGVLNAAGGSLDGAQLGVVNAIGGRATGAQLGVINVVPRALDGVQLGVVAVAGGPLEGGQFGVVNVAGNRLDGAQIGTVNVTGAACDGAQLAVANIAGGEVHGAQLGVVNVAAGRVHGLQLGLVNISEEADAAIGLVNVHARGRTQLRIGGASQGVLGAELVHGGRITHSIVSIAAQPFQARPALIAGLGFGARATIDDALHVDFDALVHAVIDDRVQANGPGILTEVRVIVGARLLDPLGVYAGIAYQLYLADALEGGLGAPVAEHSLGSRARAWPALVAGLELF